MRSARLATRTFVDRLGDEALTAWPNVAFSPVCWHLGHIAYTEALWALGPASAFVQEPYHTRFSQGGAAKSRRADSYDRAELFRYLDAVRRDVLNTNALFRAQPMSDRYLDWFVASHERQHLETITMVRRLTQKTAPDPVALRRARQSAESIAHPTTHEFISFDGGAFSMGSDASLTYDNERCAHEVSVGPFCLARRVVQAGAWAHFIECGGYEEDTFCTARDGQPCGLNARPSRGLPDLWERGNAPNSFVEFCHDGPRPLKVDSPVVGVNFFEGRAFARFVSAQHPSHEEVRLPTEVEWEFVAKNQTPEMCLHDFWGTVWQWTESAFLPYPGFKSAPYDGYSVPYFDGLHRVLRGGSFATHQSLCTPTMRNWYQPHHTEVLSGVRLAKQLR